MKNIGVSNFGVSQLADLIATARIKPAVNQIEVNPQNPRFDLIEYCTKAGVHVTAYSTFGAFYHFEEKLKFFFIYLPFASQAPPEHPCLNWMWCRI